MKKAKLVRCPACTHQFDPRAAATAPLVFIAKADSPFAFAAWLRFFRATNQGWTARYWEQVGYLYAPTDYPPIPGQSAAPDTPVPSAAKGD